MAQDTGGAAGGREIPQLQLRSDKNWQSQRTEKREKTLHMFAVSLGRGMVRYNSSNQNSLCTLMERSGLTELSFSTVAGCMTQCYMTKL